MSRRGAANQYWRRHEDEPDDPPPPPPPPTGGPLTSAYDLRAAYGVGGHPTFSSSVYARTIPASINNWVAKIADLGASHVRAEYGGSFSSAGNFTPHAGVTALAAACRTYGLKWLMLPIPEAGSLPTNQTPAQTRKVVSHIAANNADVCLGVEGLNEPQANRGGGNVPADWSTNPQYGVVPHQKAISDEMALHAELAGAVRVGSSLQAPHADSSYTQSNPVGGKKHWHQLAAAGMGAYIDWQGIHSYPGGYQPLNALGPRLVKIRDAFGKDTRIWVTETGYNNALSAPARAHRPASRPASGTYGPRAVLQHCVELGLRMDRYEALDDYNPANDEVESNFGLWSVGQASAANSYDTSSWSPKSEVTKIKAMFAALGDPAGTGPYTTVDYAVTVDVGTHTDVNHYLIQNAAGQTYVLLYRDKPVWDPVKRTAISVSSVSVAVVDAVGSRTVSVDAEVSWLLLR